MKQHFVIYRRLLSYLAPYRWHVIIAYGAMLFSALLNIVVPQIVKDAIDQGIASQRVTALFWSGGIILLIALLRGVMAFVQRLYGQWLTYVVGYNLRSDYYHAVQTLPFAFHDRAHTGDLMSRATSDTSETEQFVGIGLMDLLASTLLMIGVVIAMFIENVFLAALALPFIIAFTLASLHMGRTVEPLFKAVQKQMGKLSTMMQESLTGVSVVKAFAREPHEFERFDTENNVWLGLRSSVLRVWGNNWPLFTYLLMLGVFVLLWVGGPYVVRGEITVGSLFALISYLLILNGPVQRLGYLVNLAATASASATRVFEIIDMPSDITEPANAQAIERLQGRIEFDRVSFVYQASQPNLDLVEQKVAVAKPIEPKEIKGSTNGADGQSSIGNHSATTPIANGVQQANGNQSLTELLNAAQQANGKPEKVDLAARQTADDRGRRPALHNVTFCVEPGQTVALIGPTGSGKSTVINLLPRFYDATAGAIRIDGVDVRQMQLRSLRQQVGIVLQNPFLFSTTIAENIAYGRPTASLAEITAAAQAANAEEFITRFPDGFHTRVGERGVTLSGGQKQRIAIARALLTDPRILILDDSTSSVDTETEHQIQQALNVLMKGRTTIVIAQRLLTLKSADLILVFDQGEIVERGSHQQLLGQKGLYRRIYDLQLRDQEEFVELQRIIHAPQILKL